MENFFEWIRNNYEWVVTGLFVPIVGLIYKTKASRKKEIAEEWEALNARQQQFTDQLVKQIELMRTEIADLKDEVRDLIAQNLALRSLAPNIAVSP